MRLPRARFARHPIAVGVACLGAWASARATLEADGSRFIVVPEWAAELTSAGNERGNVVAVYYDHSVELLMAQRFGPGNAPLGAPIPIDEGLVGSSGSPAVALDADGDFVVGWANRTASGNPERFLRRFSASGEALGAPVRVDGGLAPVGQFDASAEMAVNGAGDVLMGWSSDGALAMRVQRADGTLDSPQILDPAPSGEARSGLQLSVSSDDSFLATWAATDTECSYVGEYGDCYEFAYSTTVRSQRFNADGSAVGEVATVIGPVPGYAVSTALAVHAQGGLAAVVLRDQSGESLLLAQRFDVNRAPLGDAIAIPGPADLPAAAFDGYGRFVLTWVTSQDGRLRYYDPSSVSSLHERVIAPPGIRSPMLPALDSEGSGLLLWESWLGYDTTRAASVVGQRIVSMNSADLAVGVSHPANVALSETFDLRVAVTNTGPRFRSRGVRLVDTLPEGTVFNGFAGAGWSCFAVEGVVSCDSAGLLAPGETSTVVLSLVAPATDGLVTNRAEVRAETKDPRPQNDVVISNVFAGTHDTTPEAFAFDDVEFAHNRFNVSNEITVSGTNTPVSITLSGDPTARYAINNEGFFSVPGTAYPGDRIRLMMEAQPYDNGVAAVTVQIGGTADTWTVTTADTGPDPIDFEDKSAVFVPRKFVSSNVVTLSGFNVPLMAHVENGSLGVDDAWLAEPYALVRPGQRIQIGHFAGTLPGQEVTSTLDINGRVRAAFTSTVVPDLSPGQMFDHREGVPPNTLVESAWLSISGLAAPVMLQVSGGEYRTGANWKTTPSLVENGDSVQMRHVSAFTLSSTTETTVTIGGGTGRFLSVTQEPTWATTPEAFDFTDKHPVWIPGSEQVSDIVTIRGLLEPAPIAVTTGEYRIVDVSGWQTASSTIRDGQRVQVRHKAAMQPGKTKQTKVNIGGVVGIFATTLAP